MHGAIGRAQEIAPFRLMSVDGHVSVRYLRDEFVTEQPVAGQAANARSRQVQSDLREELFLMTHSYIYHPNFLTLDVGGGPILQRGEFAADSLEAASDSTLYNLTTRATFLRDKPYRGSVFYDHLNPTISVSPGEVMTQENTQYGLNFSLLSPVTPVPLHLDATRIHNLGSGALRTVNDRIDRLNLRADRSFGARGFTQVRYYSTRQESSSGSPNLPIQRSTSTSEGLNLDSRFRLGANREYDIFNLVSYDSQKYTLSQGEQPERKDTRFLLDARGWHSDTLSTFGNYHYSSSDQGVVSSTVNAGSAGFTYRPTKNTSVALGARADDDRGGQYSTRSQGVNGTVQHQRPLPLGTMQLSYGVRYDQRDQEATAPQVNVIGERIVLAGTTAVTLARPRVIAGSVVVSNDTRTQTFVEGLDYALSVVGLETRLQRLVGGAILDGQEVLVDYRYDAGGTFAYNQNDHTLSVNWGPTRWASLFFRFLNSDVHLTSGTPTSPLNSIESTLYGARADVPLKLSLETVVGGSIEHERRQETISPYQRDAYDLYVQTEDPFFGYGTMRLTTRRTQVQYVNSPQDVDLTGHNFRFWSRHPLGIDLSADADYERDVGAPIPRRRMTTTVRARWRYRQVTLKLDLGHTRESQGAQERTRSFAQFLLQRDLGPW